jgi:hypothetical protein
MNMSCNTISIACQRTDAKVKQRGMDRRTKEKDYDLWNPDTGVSKDYVFFAEHLYNVGQVYIENLKHEKYGIVKYMKDQHCNMPEKNIINAWWVMMLRGVVWRLATVERRKGDAIPASLYENDTPIWIT